MQKKIELLVDSEAKKKNLDNSFNPTYGARAICRYRNKQIGTFIAKMIAQRTGCLQSNLLGNFKAGL